MKIKWGRIHFSYIQNKHNAVTGSGNGSTVQFIFSVSCCGGDVDFARCITTDVIIFVLLVLQVNNNKDLSTAASEISV